MDELVTRLAEASTAAIRAREAAITGGSGHLRSIHVELEIANDGDVIDTTTYLEWRQVVRRAK